MASIASHQEHHLDLIDSDGAFTFPIGRRGHHPAAQLNALIGPASQTNKILFKMLRATFPLRPHRRCASPGTGQPRHPPHPAQQSPAHLHHPRHPPYLRHFALTRLPFETPAHTDELFESNARREAEARLHHLIELKGIGLITGEVGSGTVHAVSATSSVSSRTLASNWGRYASQRAESALGSRSSELFEGVMLPNTPNTSSASRGTR